MSEGRKWKFYLDYREKLSDEVRWDYRIISSDGTWSGNLFDFYFKIINKITDNLNIPFRTIDGIRQEDTRVHKAVREAVANSIIHADYRLPRGIVIEKGKTYFKFFNPGNLRITREEALKGGVSDPRNENIFKMFNLLGVGERAGSGLENIHLAWREQKWIVPDLEETYDPDRITLTLKTTSVDKGFLEADGVGRGSKHLLSSMFDDENSSSIEGENEVVDFEVKLDDDENKILNYIISHGFITNSLCRTELDLKKHRSVKLFNSLMKKEKIEKAGTGNQIKYILKQE